MSDSKTNKSSGTTSQHGQTGDKHDGSLGGAPNAGPDAATGAAHQASADSKKVKFEFEELDGTKKVENLDLNDGWLVSDGWMVAGGNTAGNGRGSGSSGSSGSGGNGGGNSGGNGGTGTKSSGADSHGGR